MFFQLFGLRRETHHQLGSARSGGGKCRQNIGVERECDGRRHFPRDLFHFLIRGRGTSPIRNGRRANRDIGGKCRFACGQHIAR